MVEAPDAAAAIGDHDRTRLAAWRPTTVFRWSSRMEIVFMCTCDTSRSMEGSILRRGRPGSCSEGQRRLWVL